MTKRGMKIRFEQGGFHTDVWLEGAQLPPDIAVKWCGVTWVDTGQEYHDLRCYRHCPVMLLPDDLPRTEPDVPVASDSWIKQDANLLKEIRDLLKADAEERELERLDGVPPS